MSLKANHFAHHAATTGGIARPQQKPKKPEVKKPTAKKGRNKARHAAHVRRRTAAERAEAARAEDARIGHGQHGPRGRNKVRRRRVVLKRVKRNGGTTTTAKSNQTAQSGKTAGAKTAAKGQVSNGNQLAHMLGHQGQLAKMSNKHVKTGFSSRPQTSAGAKCYDLKNLGNMIGLGRSCQLLNENDSFPYRPSECRPLKKMTEQCRAQIQLLALGDMAPKQETDKSKEKEPMSKGKMALMKKGMKDTLAWSLPDTMMPYAQGDSKLAEFLDGYDGPYDMIA